MKITDNCGYPIAMFMNSPFRNAFRWFGLFITGQLRLRRGHFCEKYKTVRCKTKDKIYYICAKCMKGWQIESCCQTKQEVIYE